MTRVTTKGVIKTAIVSAFTIATALIWKDFISGVIIKIVPPSELLFYQFLAALISTIILIIVLYLILKTGSEAEIVLKKIKPKNNKKIKQKRR